ncbi:hypothetical protein OV079_44125 [Nannocystis pusilla]|uniref:Uncharacterized protein n=1 Tax=Nannocystis pusilla TaxID=889268 RepID=A0A9X3EZG0_9BACT|nr:hypothetical protein [Nannocystis pusilla]MCY1012410.1 hypothetical protein [Nannocystis pusilla]
MQEDPIFAVDVEASGDAALLRFTVSFHELGATHGLVAIRERVSGGPLRLFAARSTSARAAEVPTPALCERQ